MIVDALPLRPGLRVLEIGCGPGAMARAIAARIGDGHVLAIDRSAKAIAQAAASSQADIALGRLSLRCIAVEEFELGLGEAPYDIAVAVRVGALDGRHPEAGERARRRIAAAGRAIMIIVAVSGLLLTRRLAGANRNAPACAAQTSCRL